MFHRNYIPSQILNENDWRVSLHKFVDVRFLHTLRIPITSYGHIVQYDATQTIRYITINVYPMRSYRRTVSRFNWLASLHRQILHRILKLSAAILSLFVRSTNVFNFRYYHLLNSSNVCFGSIVSFFLHFSFCRIGCDGIAVWRASKRLTINVKEL